ncbi:MAG TPA: carbamoyl phosphate synthase small subunit [Candidatus Acidoferrum sp.]|nr:carbamoyl phosphate synthase small subunit [Candidatus Acidoferrum sp.]
MKSESYLLLSDGSVYPGRPLGARGVTIGEACFDTGMTGYQEMLTDPSFYGQVVAMTFPLAGNYGVNNEDVESGKPWVSGFVVRECCENPSNFRSKGTLDSYLQEYGVVGIQGVDTRALTRKLRRGGGLNMAIVSGVTVDEDDLMRRLKAFTVKGSVEAVSVTEDVSYPIPNPRFRVSVLDCGYKRNIVRCLNKWGCEVVVKPYNTKAEDLVKGFDGVMLTNGPGDPADNPGVIAEIAKVMQTGTPVFGICLGHQLMALASGFTTAKMPFGHRGGNHPVYSAPDDRVFITSQNHGYAVKAETVDPELAEISHVNRHDNSVEGLIYKKSPAFSVQFHPEASPGPQDNAYLFGKFMELMEGGARHA